MSFRNLLNLNIIFKLTKMEKLKNPFKFKIVMHTFQKLSTKLLTMKILEVGGYFFLTH